MTCLKKHSPSAIDIMKVDNKDWKEKYEKYIISPEWYNLKIDLLEKRGCKCEKCGKPKKPTQLQIHHLTYERLYNELPEDLLILCAVCHMKEHGLIKEKKKRIYKKPKRKKKYHHKKTQGIAKKIYNRERQANDKFIGAKRRKMKGKSLPAWMQ